MKDDAAQLRPAEKIVVEALEDLPFSLGELDQAKRAQVDVGCAEVREREKGELVALEWFSEQVFRKGPQVPVRGPPPDTSSSSR